MECLLDHVDLKFTLAAAFGREESTAEPRRQVPQVGRGDDLGGGSPGGKLLTQPRCLVEVHLVADDIVDAARANDLSCASRGTQHNRERRSQALTDGRR
jgi:hypothetical protein